MDRARNPGAPLLARQVAGVAMAWVLAALVAPQLAVAPRVRAAQQAETEPSAPAREQPMRIREGATIEVTGYFKVAADRAIFTTADGSARYSGLENLNLERIAIAVAESPDQLLWNVTGTVTEFRGANYLLVTRAMLKSKSEPPSKSVMKSERGKVSAAR